MNVASSKVQTSKVDANEETAPSHSTDTVVDDQPSRDPFLLVQAKANGFGDWFLVSQ